MAKLLIRMTSAPYGSSNASDGLDFALAATSYGHEIAVLFEGNGLYQLYPQVQVKGVKNQVKRIKSLPFFDVDECYFSTSDVTLMNIDTERFPDIVAPLNDAGVIMQIEQADHVVTF